LHGTEAKKLPLYVETLRRQSALPCVA